MKPTARLKKKLSKENNYHIGKFRLPSEEFRIQNSDQEVVSQLLETYFPDCQQILDKTSQYLDSVDPPTEDNWLEASTIITEDNIK
jgi:DNA polymerase III sliding clamp (beta) subunit (PCNA family)